MDILNQIVEKLTKDELRFLKYYYGAITDDQRKDLMLIDYVRQSKGKFDEEKIIRKLKYNSANKNSYYRLKNRVIRDIGDSLVLLNTHKNALYELQHYLTLYAIYSSKGLFEPCLFYLKKAERLARATEQYELLDSVYANFIRLSSDLPELNPAPYIVLREQNASLISHLRELDNLLGTVSYKLKFSQNFGASDNKSLLQLSAVVKIISKQTSSHYSKNLQIRIYKALSQVLLQQHNYVALENLVHENLQRFEKEKWFDRENHELKLQMLTYLANALYKNSKFKNSLVYTMTLGKEIEEYKRAHYDRFVFFFYNLQILNNAVLNPALALKVLTQFEDLMSRKKNYYHDVFIYLNRAGLLYDLGRYQEALKSLVKLYVNDNYRQADNAFRFKVEVSELIITYEAKDYQTLLHRIEQVRHDYKKLSGQKGFTRDFAIIKLLSSMANTANSKLENEVQRSIQLLLKRTSSSLSQDSEIIRYESWLHSKLKKK